MRFLQNVIKCLALLLFLATSLLGQTPTLVNSQTQMSTTFAQGSTGNGNPTTGCWDTGTTGLNPYYFCLADATAAGNTVIASCEWATTTGLGTPTLVDDQSQTYTSQK